MSRIFSHFGNELRTIFQFAKLKNKLTSSECSEIDFTETKLNIIKIVSTHNMIYYLKNEKEYDTKIFYK